MKNVSRELRNRASRRSFMKKGLAAGTATLGAGMLTNRLRLFADDDEGGELPRGDAAILKFLRCKADFLHWPR